MNNTTNPILLQQTNITSSEFQIITNGGEIETFEKDLEFPVEKDSE